MPWTTKIKQLSTTANVGYTNTDPKVFGRSPQIEAISFSPHELYGAAARCSHMQRINPSIATPESEMIAKLIEPHVDNVGDDFAILASADSFKDYVKSYFAGTVATGLAYLAMTNDGYVWADHFENVGGGNPAYKRKPDFVFSGIGTGVALMEAKGSRSGLLSGFDSVVADGYTGQVEPHLGRLVGNAMATHGYCIGSWIKSTKQAELRIHHTRTHSSQNSTGGFDAPSSVDIQRHNFATAFTLAHSMQLGKDLRRGRSRTREIIFLRTEWLGRHWLSGLEAALAFWPAFFDWPFDPHVTHRLMGRKWPFRIPYRLFFAVEERVAKTVLATFLDIGDGSAIDIPDLDPIDLDTRNAAREYRGDAGGGAVFADGLALIDSGDRPLRFEMVIWDSARARFREI